MLDIIIAGFLASRNAGMAGRKGYNRWMYGLITFFGFIVAEGLCMMLLLAYKYRGDFDAVAISKFLTQNIPSVLMIMLCGIGVYLLVRYILEQMPDKNINNNNKKDNDWLKNFGR